MIKLIQMYLLNIYRKDIASVDIIVPEFSVAQTPRTNPLDLEHVNSSSAWVGWTPIPDYMNGQREVFEGESF